MNILTKQTFAVIKEANPLFVVHLGDKTLKVNKPEFTSDSTIIDHLRPEWVESIEVSKGYQALQLPRDMTSAVDHDFGYYKISGTYIAPSNFEKHFPGLVEKFK